MTDWIPPLTPSAPSTEAGPVDWVNPAAVADELKRAQAELLWAINKHRLAWDLMERLNGEYAEKGNAFFKDNERPWKLAVGDVQWWRGEVSSRSNAVLALTKLAQLFSVDVGPGWTEVTDFGDTGVGRRVFYKSRP